MTTFTSRLHKVLKVAVLVFALVFTASGASHAVIGPALKAGSKFLDDALEAAAKVSGKPLSPAARNLAVSQLRNAAVKHGDEVLLAARKGGLELMEVAGKYGDDVWQFASKVPAGARALAMRPRELLPLTRRIGTEVLQVEAKAPGLTVHVVKNFGDDGVSYFAKHVPADDATRLIGYAEKAESPAVRKALLQAYKKEGKSLFERIPPKLVLATGLTAAMLYGTHRVTEPAAALSDAIREQPDVAHTAVQQFTMWGAVGGVIVIVLLLWRFGMMPWHGKRAKGAEKAIGNAS